MSDGNFTEVDTILLSVDDFLNFTDVDDMVEEEEDYWPAYLTWIQKVFASLSIICSYVICREAISDLKDRRRKYRSTRSVAGNSNRGGRTVLLQQSIGRILLQLSISDIVFSIAVFLGEWPAPKDTLYIHHAAGNQQFCTFQGWMRAFGYVASPMFSVALNAFYLLLIRYRWQDSKLSSLEKKVTIAIWVYALVLSIIPIPLQAYNSDWDVCWISPSPLDCIGDECTRGAIATKLRFFYSFFHIWACMLACVVLMLLLFKTVRNLEDRSKAYVATSSRQSVMNGGRHSSSATEAVEPTGHTDSETPSEAFTSRGFATSEAFTAHGFNSELFMDSSAAFNVGPTDSKKTVVVTIHKGSDFHDEAQTDTDDSCRTHSTRTQAPRSTPSTTLDACTEEANQRADVEQPLPPNNALRSVAASIVHRTRNSVASTDPSSLRSNTSHRKSRAVAYQGILYTLAFMSTHLFDMIAVIIWKAAEVWHLNFDIVSYMVMQPALGIFNFVIFSRNRTNMATPEGRFLRKILVCCGGFRLCKRHDDDEVGHLPSADSGHHSSSHQSHEHDTSRPELHKISSTVAMASQASEKN